ncbi:MAG: acetylornithine transaminase [Chloroflexi bacterium]|nr:acetylornithine transaminase [Chloroflexota bacterium]
MSKWQELEARYFMTTGKRQPVTIVRGKGVKVWDEDGKEYLDFVAGIAVNSLGHCHPVVRKALSGQASKLIHVSNIFYHIPQIQLAELLVQNSCMERAYFVNSGAEANEGAVKLARKYGKLHLSGAYAIITAMDSFHGRTLAMVAATGQPKYQEPFTPLPEGFVNVEFNSIEAIMEATNEKTCAVMLEPVQGEGGVNVPNDSYLKQVRAWCDERGLLLIMDEIQTGIGRLGTLFGYQQFGVEPDIMTLGKGLAGGFPIGALLAKETASVFKPGDHGSTFGGNPLACAVGYETLKFILEKDVVSNVSRLGDHLKQSFNKLKATFPFITEVRGRGLLMALQFNGEIAADVVKTCLEGGLLLNPVKPDAIRFMPPLVVKKAEVDKAISILTSALEKVAKDKKLM